jgi:hypothetical protein
MDLYKNDLKGDLVTNKGRKFGKFDVLFEVPPKYNINLEAKGKKFKNGILTLEFSLKGSQSTATDDL